MHAVMARSTYHFQVKMYKAPGVQTTFGGSDVEKVHAVVVRSTFRSQNAQNTSVSDHFWELRCRKSARRCGGSAFLSQNVTTHVLTTFGRSDVVAHGRRKALCTIACQE